MSVRNWKVLACAGTIKIGLGVCGIYMCRYAAPLEGFVVLGSTFPIALGFCNFMEVEDILSNSQKDENKKDQKD